MLLSSNLVRKFVVGFMCLLFICCLFYEMIFCIFIVLSMSMVFLAFSTTNGDNGCESLKCFIFIFWSVLWLFLVLINFCSFCMVIFLRIFVVGGVCNVLFGVRNVTFALGFSLIISFCVKNMLILILFFCVIWVMFMLGK